MAKNHVQEGRIMTWTNGTGSAVLSGAVVVVGTLVCIALGDIANGATGELALMEVWEIAKDPTVAIGQGVDVFWDAGNSRATSAAAGNTHIGQAFVAALQAATTLKVRFTSASHAVAAAVALADVAGLTARTDVEGAIADLLVKAPVEIADPGASGAIPVTRSGVVAITSAGAETRTLAIPAVAGTELVICSNVDGGDAVITVASAINQTGNNTITLNDAGDTVVLKAIKKAGALAWRVVVNDGAALSTV